MVHVAKQKLKDFLNCHSREEVLIVAPVEAEAEASTSDALSKEEAVIGNATYRTLLHLF